MPPLVFYPARNKTRTLFRLAIYPFSIATKLAIGGSSIGNRMLAILICAT